MLFKDEYTSANEVLIDPRNPNTLYATLWSQQQSFIEGQGFGNAGMGIFKSTDGGTTWTQLVEGLPAILQANIAIAPSDPNILYATIAPGQGPIGFYKSTDGGAHWFQAIQGPGRAGRTGAGHAAARAHRRRRPSDRHRRSQGSERRLHRIDGDVAHDGRRAHVERRARRARRRRLPAHLDQPERPDIILAVADQGAVVSANRGLSWSNWYNQNTAAMYHVTTDNAFPYRVCSGQQDSGSACVQSRSDDGRITFHDWHPVNIQEYGMAAPDPKNPDVVFGSQRNGVSRYDRRTAQTTQVGPDTSGTLPGGGAMNRNVRTMPLHLLAGGRAARCTTRPNVVWKSIDHGHSWTRISPDLTRATWAVPANTGKYARTGEAGADGQHHRAQPEPALARASSGRAPTTATSR